MNSLDSLDEEQTMEIQSWIIEYLVYMEKFNDYYSFIKENKHLKIPQSIRLFIKYYEMTNKLSSISTYFLIFLMDEIYTLVEHTNKRSEFVQLYCNFYVENLLDELKEYVNKSNAMQYKKYLTKLRNLSYNEIMKDDIGKKICNNTIKKYEKIITTEKTNEIINLAIDYHYYIGIMKENNLNNSFISFTKLMKSICFANPPVLIQIYNNKDEISEIISKNENNINNEEEEGNEENENGEGKEGAEEEEEEETDDESDNDIKLKPYSPSAIPNKRQSIYNPIEEDKMNIKIRKINPITKELQIQNSNIRRLDEPHDSAEEVKWDDQNTPPFDKNNKNNKSVFRSSSNKTKKLKIAKDKTVYQNGRVRFTQKEVDNLLNGVKKFGVGKWKEILGCYEFNSKRTAVDLKDKYRNIQKMRYNR